MTFSVAFLIFHINSAKKSLVEGIYSIEVQQWKSDCFGREVLPLFYFMIILTKALLQFCRFHRLNTSGSTGQEMVSASGESRLGA